MSNSNTWVDVCALEDILPDTGICARLRGKPIAVFRLASGAVYAIDNRDPNCGAGVLARGIVGSIGERVVVASPMYKHHFDLATGDCLENPQASVRAYTVRANDGRVEVALPPAPPRQHLVVIGNGMAGMRTVEELLALAPERYEITVFGAEPHGNYNRVMLSPVLAGEKTLNDIMIHDRAWYARNGVTLHAGDPVVAIDRRRRMVQARSGIEMPYDRLLIATGSQPVQLPLPGRELSGVLTFRDIADVDAMLESARRYSRAVVIGGGLLGIEAAVGLANRGMQVTLLHNLDVLMNQQLDAEASRLLVESLEQRNLTIKLKAETEAILGNKRVSGVRFKDGSEIAADLVVMAVGIRPNITLAKNAGLYCDRGIVVDDTMQTYDPRIYAVGECAQHRKTTYGLVEPLYEQAEVCASHLAGLGRLRYGGTVLATRLKVAGIEVFSAGEFVAGEGAEQLVMKSSRGVYRKLVLRDDRVVGAILFGDTTDAPWYLDLMRARTDVSDMRDRLMLGRSFCEAA